MVTGGSPSGKNRGTSIKSVVRGGHGVLTDRSRATCQTRGSSGDGAGSARRAPRPWKQAVGRRLSALRDAPVGKKGALDPEGCTYSPEAGPETWGRYSPGPLSSSSWTRDHSRRATRLQQRNSLGFFPPRRRPLLLLGSHPSVLPHLLFHFPIAARAEERPPLRPFLRLFIGRGFKDASRGRVTAIGGMNNPSSRMREHSAV